MSRYLDSPPIQADLNPLGWSKYLGYIVDELHTLLLASYQSLHTAAFAICCTSVIDDCGIVFHVVAIIARQ